MKIASFNINGIKARLPRLLEWLEETRPSVACLQEIKTQDEGFPAEEFEKIGYQAIWHGQKGFNGVAILADGEKPVEIQRGLAGEPEDEHSRYIEAEVFGMRIAGIYLPNGNPQPGPKFDYKLRWMDRLRKRMAEIRALEIPAVVGRLQRHPHRPRHLVAQGDGQRRADATGSRDAYLRLLNDGWTDAIATHNPDGGVWTYWDYQAGAAA
jgi:exodeoxyribonuclease-3